MSNFIENPIILSTLSGVSIQYKEFKRRASSALIIKISGRSTYHFFDGNIQLNAGNILFIPAGENYTVRKTSTEESRYALINFDAEVYPQRPTIFASENFLKILSTFHEISKSVLINHEKNRYATLSSFYRILALLSNENEFEYLNSRKANLLKPALAYMEEHLFDSELKIDALSQLCGVSNTYFRKLFTMYMGRTPRKFIIEKRLEKAKTIIDEGNYMHLYEVAEETGFSDSLYFSRVFKQYYGVSPRQMEQQH